MANKASGPDRRVAKNSPRRGEAGTRARQDRALRAVDKWRAFDMIIDGKTSTDIAAAMGRSVPWVYQVMRDPEVAERLREISGAMAEAARQRLSLALDGLVDELIEITKHGTREHGPRVKAIEIGLDRAGVYVDKPDVKVTVTNEAELLSEDQIEAKLAAIAAKLAAG